MKKAIFLLFVLTVSLLYYGGAFTKKGTLPFSKEFFSVEAPSSGDQPFNLKGFWSSKRKNPGFQGSTLNPKELEQLFHLQLDKGIRNCPTLSWLLMRESEKARQRGKLDQAVELATYAIKFSPDRGEPYFGLAKALWYQSPFQADRIAREIFRGQMARFRYYPSSLQFFYNLFYILSNAILMTFIIFGVVILVKYLSLYFYDLRKGMAQEVPGFLINGVKVFLLFVPFLLGLDILWALLFWSILVWGFVTRRERQLMVFFLILLVYFPFLLRSSSAFLDGSSSDVILAMNRANHEDWNKSVEKELVTWLSAHPNDPEVLFTLGLIAKKEGRYSEAEEYYQKAIQQKPQFSEALCNLGNVYLAKKRADLALSSYQQAADLDPQKASYFFNLHRAYSQEALLSGKGDKAIQRARQLDPKLVDFYSGIDSPNLNRLVIDEVLTTQRLWKRCLAQLLGSEGFLFVLFRAWFEPIPARMSFLLPVFFLAFLLAISRYSRTKRFLTRCPMCGSATHRFYLGSSDQEFICFNCHRIFVQKEKLHPKIAEKKALQVRQFEKQNQFVGKFLSFFLVGFGHLWGKHPLKGLLLLFLFFVFILKVVYWNGVVSSSMFEPSLGFWRIVFWGSLFTLFYILSLRMIYRTKPEWETQKERPREH